MLLNSRTFFTVTVLLGSPGKDKDIQGRIKRKAKKCSDQDRAGLKFSKLGVNPASCLDICLSEYVFFGIVDRIFQFEAKDSQNLEK